jgi:hypothetical protein
VSQLKLAAVLTDKKNIKKTEHELSKYFHRLQHNPDQSDKIIKSNQIDFSSSKNTYSIIINGHWHWIRIGVLSSMIDMIGMTNPCFHPGPMRELVPDVHGRFSIIKKEYLEWYYHPSERGGILGPRGFRGTGHFIFKHLFGIYSLDSEVMFDVLAVVNLPTNSKRCP